MSRVTASLCLRGGASQSAVWACSRLRWGCEAGHTTAKMTLRAGGIERKDQSMAKKQSAGVYRIVDVVGVSDKSWEDAGRRAIETAANSLRDLRVAEVTQMDMKVEDGRVTAFRTRVALSFKYEG